MVSAVLTTNPGLRNIWFAAKPWVCCLIFHLLLLWRVCDVYCLGKGYLFECFGCYVCLVGKKVNKLFSFVEDFWLSVEFETCLGAVVQLSKDSVQRPTTRTHTTFHHFFDSFHLQVRLFFLMTAHLTKPNHSSTTLDISCSYSHTITFGLFFWVIYLNVLGVCFVLLKICVL